MPPYFAWTRRRRFRRSTVSTQCCRCRRVAPSGTVSNPTVMKHYRCTLYAALDVKTGKVHGMTAARHTSREFIAFLEGLVARTGWAKQIHVVLDNLGTQDQGRRAVSRNAFAGAPAFHAHLLFVAQPGRTVVRQDPARRH